MAGDRVWGDWSATPDHEKPATADRRQLANQLDAIAAQIRRGDDASEISPSLERAAGQARQIGNKER